MLVTTQDELSDYQITKTLGLVKGNTIRARYIRKDILAALRSMVGGEISEYTKMIAESREQALDRMIEQAQEMGLMALFVLDILPPRSCQALLNCLFIARQSNLIKKATPRFNSVI